MQERFKAGKNKNTIVVMLISIGVHILGFLLIVPFISFDDPPPPADDKNLEVRVMNDTDFQKILKQKKLKKKKKPKPKPIVKKPEEKKPVIPMEPLKKRKAVEQVTNQVRPKVASYVSENDNKVEKQTRARETKAADKPSDVEKKASPKEPNKEKQEEERKASKFGQTLNPAEKPKPIEGLVRNKKPEKKLGNPFQKPSLHEAEMTLSKPGFSKRKMESRAGRKFMKNYEKNDKALKASLENFIPEVKPGNHTGVNAHKNVAATYLAHIHRKIHPLWANNYLMKLDLYESINSELNNPGLGTKLEFIIDGKSGEVETINIVKSSGALRFDAEAIAIGHQVGPHRKAPTAIVSPNGKVYIHWNFWRNQRQCGTFGASVFLLDKDV